MRRNSGQLQVAAGHGGRLGALFEQRAVQVDLHIKFAGGAFIKRLFKHGPHLAVPVFGYGRGRDAQHHFALRQGGQGGGGAQSGGGAKQGAAGDLLGGHAVVS